MATNKNYLQEIEDLKVQLEEVQRELEQYKNRVETLAESMADYRVLWMTVCRENELLKRELPSDADYPCYSQARYEEGSSPYYKHRQHSCKYIIRLIGLIHLTGLPSGPSSTGKKLDLDDDE